MTHEELLKRLWEKRNALCDNLDVHFALTAVVELHKPEKWDGEDYDRCAGCYVGTRLTQVSTSYPCKTIQAIEKELG